MASIAIDYTPAYHQRAGIGRLVRGLVRELSYLDRARQYTLLVSGARRTVMPDPPAPNFHWVTTRITPDWWARIWHRAHIPLPINWLTGSVDLFHATDFVLPPTSSHVRTIVQVHDLTFARVPHAASTSLKSYLDRVVPRSVHRATFILADSQATRQDLLELYNVPADRVSVVLSGVEPMFKRVTDPHVHAAIRKKYDIAERPYILSVGTVQPRKNYSRVIRALAALRAAGYDLGLVIVGGRGWLEDEMYHTIHATGMQDYVTLTGFADEDDLPVLYSMATCVAFPSLYEGFGFPVLEGMACGTPVVTSNISSLPEVAGDAALLVDPYDVDAIADAVRRILHDSDLRQSLIERGYRQAAQFTWERSARQLLTVYEHVLQM